MKELVDQIKTRLKDQSIEVPEEEIVARLKKLVDDFHVPEAEARRSVINYFLKEHGVVQVRASSVPVKVNEISEPNRWVDLEVKVLALWEPASDAIAQTGLVGDSTGNIKFVKWAKSGLPDLVEGKSYSISRVVTDQYQGKPSVKLNRTSQVAELDHDIDAVAVIRSGPAEDKKIADISEAGLWVNLRVKVVQLWDPNSETISQSGLVGDETGSLKFVKWAKSGLPELAEAKSYSLQNVVTDEYQGRFSVKLNRTSQIIELDSDIEVGSQSVDFTGAMVDIQKGSGLIKRCPICRRSLTKGICGEHGKVDGTYDLRIKAVLDDGRRVHDIIINRETTERLVGLTLEEAKKMAMDTLDHEVVRSMIEERLLGRYYAVTGPRVDRYILVETINEAPAVAANDVDELISLVEVD